MEQARLQCQQHPSYGYPTEAAAAWMVARRDTVTTADVPSPVKFHHQQRSSPYPSPVMGHVASRISATSASTPRSAMARRNERERKRVRLVNHGFATLRQYLPQSSNSRKKLSKMETLRSAIEYIKQLQFLLDPTSSAPSPPQYGEPSSDPPSWSASGPPSWDDSWAQQSQQPRSPSPHTSLSPEADLIDFAAFS